MSRPEVESRAAALRAERVPFVHATVVLADRPTSAKPGDEAIVFADGTIEGFVGGTCAESTVRAKGLALLDSGEPLLLRITPSPEDDDAWAGSGTGQGSEAAPGAGASPGSDRLSVHNPCLSGGTLEIFLEPVIPAPLLVVHGDSPIARALTDLAGGLGLQVVPSTSSVPSDGGLPEPDLSAIADAAAVVCASHGRDEEPVLEAALRAGVAYVGLVASRKRGEGVVASLDVDEAARARVHTPAGLDIGARTPEEVALSILAEIVSERRRTSGRPVAEHPGHEHFEHPGHGHPGHEHFERPGHGHPVPDHHEPDHHGPEHDTSRAGDLDDHAAHTGHHDQDTSGAPAAHGVAGHVGQHQHEERSGSADVGGSSAHQGTRPAMSGRPGTATDPVCGMTVATVEASLHLDHEGVRYWFCGTGCLRAFAADPARYLAS